MELDLTGRRREDPLPEYARRLRPLIRLCAALLGVPVLLGVLSWVMVGQPGDAPLLPKAFRISLALFGAILILLSSRFRTMTLRRVIPRTAELEVKPETLLAAYRRATLISFVILGVAALVGLLVALGSGLALYGIVLCVASALGMLSRWPRATEVDHLVRRRARP